MNKIQMKQVQSHDNNLEVIDVFVNDRFYTAIVGIKFGKKPNTFTKYKFIHEDLNSLVESDECSDRLFNSLMHELLNLEQHELTDLIFWD